MATDSPYWNPKTETLDRDRIEALQLAKLRRQCEWATARSPWYRRRLREERFDPGKLRTLGDLRRIPLLTRDEWMASQEARPPYGEIPVIAGAGAIRTHTTSGTTGRGPLRALDSRQDWAWIAEMWCYGIWGAGIRPLDTAYIAFGYGSFIGFWGLHYAMEKIGVLKRSRRCAADRGARAPDRRLRRHRGGGHADLRDSPGPGGRAPGHRPARLERQPADPVRGAGRLDSPDQGADRGALERQGLRHGRDDRDRHDHGVRVRRAARRHAHHRGPT